MNLAFSSNAYRNFSLMESIESIASIGYSGIEIMCDIPHAFPPLTTKYISEIKEKINKHKLQISNLNGFMMCAIQDFHHPSWIEESDTYRQKRIEHTKNCILLAKELGVKSISTEPGGPEISDREEKLDLFEKGIKEVLPLAEKHKIHLLIEPEPELLIQNSNQFLEFIQRFNSDFVGLNFDVGHFFCVNEKPEKLIIELQDHIKHIHLEDIGVTKKHEHLIPGKGVIDFGKIFESIEKIEYNGFVTIELYPYLDSPYKAAKEAFNFLNSKYIHD